MRPRRTTQLTEGRGVSANDFNLLATRLMVFGREYFDRIKRAEDQIATQIVDPTIASNAVRADIVQDFSIAERQIAKSNISVGDEYKGVPFATRAAAVAATIPAAVLWIRLLGYAAAGDCVEVICERVSADPGHSAALQSADGAWWVYKNPVLRPEMFGATGDGVADDQPALQNLVDTAATLFRVADIPDSGAFYKLGATLTLPSSTRLRGRGLLKLADAVNNHTVQSASGAFDIQIEGIIIDANRAGQTVPGSHALALARGTGGSDITVRGIHVRNATGSGIFASGSTLVDNIKVLECLVEDTDQAGISIGGNTSANRSRMCTIQGNTVRRSGTANIGMGVSEDSSIIGNTCELAGQATPPGIADNITFYDKDNRRIVCADNVCDGSGNNGIHGGGDRIVYKGNSVHGATFYGLIHENSDLSNSHDVVISGNNISESGYDGVSAAYVIGLASAGNRSSLNGRRGFNYNNCSSVSSVGDGGQGNALEGFRGNIGSDWTIAAPAFLSNGTVGSPKNGMTLTTLAGVSVVGGALTGNTSYGLGVASDCSNVALAMIDATGNTVGALDSNRPVSIHALHSDQKPRTAFPQDRRPSSGHSDCLNRLAPACRRLGVPVMEGNRAFATPMAAAVYDDIHAAASNDQLHSAVQRLYAEYGTGKIGDDDEQFLRSEIGKRRSPARTFFDPNTRSLRASLRIGRFVSRAHARSPDRKASRDRRRKLGGSGTLPHHMRENYTEGQRAVLTIIAGEIKHHGTCDLYIGKISALAGVCRTTAQTTLHEAARLGHISVTERRRPGRKNLTNIIRIISPEWIAWVKRAPSAHRQIGSNLVKKVSPTKSTDSKKESLAKSKCSEID